MRSSSPLLRLLAAAAFAATLLSSGCRKSPAPEPAAPAASPASTAPALVPPETTATTEVTTAPQAIPETAPFFSERFLPPDQRLQRRQQRILDTLETTATGPAQES